MRNRFSENCRGDWERGGEDSDRRRSGWHSRKSRRDGAHPFYARVNELLEEKKFDEFAERECGRLFNVKKPWAAIFGARSLFCSLNCRLYLNSRINRARNRLAGGGFVGLAEISGQSIEEQTPDSFDDLTDAAADRCEDLK